MPDPLNKSQIRRKLNTIRKTLSHKRREEVTHTLLSMIDSLSPYRTILSFSSTPDEINTSLLNRYLAHTGRLLLPKVFQKTLKIYRIQSPELQLKKQAFNLLEPIDSICTEIALEEIDSVLVPALGFDRNFHRIGFGKGFYDRFLSSLPNIHTIGLGFKEQLVNFIPTEPHDFPLKAISLF